MVMEGSNFREKFSFSILLDVASSRLDDEKKKESLMKMGDLSTAEKIEDSSPYESATSLNGSEEESSSNGSEVELSMNESKVKSNSKPNYNLHKKKSKPQNITTFTTFKCVEDIRNLNRRRLVDKYALPISNELTKHYGYKCAILPEECHIMFKGFGSEKKAHDMMKMHLEEHLQDLELRIENGTWPPKHEVDLSQGTKVFSARSHKRGKISLKTEHPSGVKKPPRKERTSVREEISKKEPIIRRKNKNLRTDSQSTNLMDVTPPSKLCKLGSPILDRSVGEEIVQEEIAPIDCISFSKLKYVKEAMKREHSIPEKPAAVFNKKQVLVVNWEYSMIHSYCAKNEEMKKKFIEKGEMHKAKSLLKSRIQHYGTTGEFQQPISHLRRALSRRKQCPLHGSKEEECDLHIKGGFCLLPPELYFHTGPFPYVYKCEWPEDAIEKVETGSGCTCYSSVEDPVEARHVNILTAESSLVLKRGVFKKNSRVLECVDNRVDASTASVRITSSSPSEHTKENAENGEAERALEILSKFQSKKKKNNQEPLQCKICNKIFTAHATLIHHYRGHAKIKPYRCDQCDVTFTRKHSLKYHLSIHANKSRFTCSECEREFRHPSHFKEHLRRHTGETPFECQFCPQRFRTKNSYKRHMRIAHKKKLTNGDHLEDIPEV